MLVTTAEWETAIRSRLEISRGLLSLIVRGKVNRAFSIRDFEGHGALAGAAVPFWEWIGG